MPTFIQKISYFYDYRLIAVYVYTYELDNIKYIDLSNDITYRCSACQELEYEYEKHNVSEIITKDKKGKVADMSYYGIDYCKDLPENFHEEFIKTLVYMGEKP